MSRITGSDALKMFEAYAAVYASEEQEITEEQIWEEVENWVNSLLEEGYDLSDHTWEEMYEAYIEEDGVGIGQGLRQQFGRFRRSAGDVIGAAAQGLGGQTTTSKNPLARGYNALTRVASTPTRFAGDVVKGFATGKGSTPAKPTEKPSLSNIPTSTKNSPYTAKNLGADQFKAYKAGGGDAAMSKGTGTAAQIIARGRAAMRGTGAADGGGGGGGLGAGAPKPSETKVSPTRPSTKGPSIGTTKAGTKFVQRAATSDELKAAQAARKAGGGEEGAIKAAVARSQPTTGPAAAKVDPGSVQKAMQAFKPTTTAAASSASPAASGSVVPAAVKVASAPKPITLAPRQTAREKMLNQSYEYDAYDLVLEYLLDNGHAETVDEAHYIMLEMDAQMVGDIVEGSAELSAAARKRAEELGRKRRSTKEYKQGGNRRTGHNERAAYNLSNVQRTPAANPSTQVSRSKKPAGYDTGAHKGDYERFNRSKPEKNPKHDANK